VQATKLAAITTAMDDDRRAIFADLCARDPQAARDASALAALAPGGVRDEMLAQLLVAAHRGAIACLDTAVRCADVAARQPGAPPAVLQGTVRTIGGSLRTASRLMKTMQKGMSQLGRDPGSRQPAKRSGVRAAGRRRV
jgi:ethanolamine utilization microcompartment shell protein EutL